MSDQWLSIVEYARQFNMSDMTVRRRIKTGRIQAVLREGKYYIPISEALRKMAQRDNGHTSAPAPQPAPAQRMIAQQPIVKSHPAAERTYAAPAPSMPMPQMQQIQHHPQPAPMPTHHTMVAPVQQPQRPQNTNAHGLIPQAISQHDAATLLAFCEGALRKSQEAEQRLEQYYKERVLRLESELTQKESNIKQLAQQVEDLQLLTKILEKKSRNS